jgi:pyruvate dehydrogenase (quinone)
MVFLGNPEYGCELQPMDFEMVARAYRGTGFSVENPADCDRVLDEALATPGPVMVEGVVDPFEPPLPTKIGGKPWTSPPRSSAGSRVAPSSR